VRYITFADDFVNLSMTEEMDFYLHQYHICGQVVCSEGLIL